MVVLSQMETSVLYMENTDVTFQVLFTSALKMYNEFLPAANNLL